MTTKTKMTMLRSNTETNSSLKMELSTKDNGNDNNDMVSVSKYGLMVQGMKASGKQIKLTVKESSGM